jgi:hypothetical protein
MHEALALKIPQELRCRRDPGYEEMIACTGACDVQQMALGVIDLREVPLVCDRFDPRLQR